MPIDRKQILYAGLLAAAAYGLGLASALHFDKGGDPEPSTTEVPATPDEALDRDEDVAAAEPQRQAHQPGNGRRNPDHPPTQLETDDHLEDADGQQKALEKDLEAALVAAGGRLIEVDCERLPCVSVFFVPSDYAAVNGSSPLQGFTLVRALLDDAGYVDTEVSWAKTTANENGVEAIIVLAQGGPNPNEDAALRGAEVAAARQDRER